MFRRKSSDIVDVESDDKPDGKKKKKKKGKNKASVDTAVR